MHFGESHFDIIQNLFVQSRSKPNYPKDVECCKLLMLNKKLEVKKLLSKEGPCVAFNRRFVSITLRTTRLSKTVVSSRRKRQISIRVPFLGKNKRSLTD